MGCCLSTNNTEPKSSKPNPSKHNSSYSLKKDNPNSTPTPTPTPAAHTLVEDETVVKEVLSETPSLPKQPISLLSEDEPIKEPLDLEHCSPNAKLVVSRPDNQVQTRYSPKAKAGVTVAENSCYSSKKNRVEHSQNQHRRTVERRKPERVVSNKKQATSEEVSEEVSEICSTLTETSSHLADDDNEVTQTARRNRVVGRPQRRRSEASPGRVRSGPVRGLNNNNGMQRRSRSPVTRVDGAGWRTGLSRCPSGRRTGAASGRFGPPELVQKNSKVENVGNTKTNSNGDGDGDGDGEANLDPTNDESLENPHVSMECFIFL